MTQKILSDLGENYEYIRTIVTKRIELYKIELSEKLGEIIGVLIFVFLGIFIINLIFLGLLVLLGIWLTKIIGSIYLGILVVLLVLCLTFYSLIVFRRVLIVTPIIAILDHIINKIQR